MDISSIKKVLASSWNNVEDLLILSDAFLDLELDYHSLILRNCAELKKRFPKAEILGATDSGDILATYLSSTITEPIVYQFNPPYHNADIMHPLDRDVFCRLPISSIDDSYWHIVGKLGSYEHNYFPWHHAIVPQNLTAYRARDVQWAKCWTLRVGDRQWHEATQYHALLRANREIIDSSETPKIKLSGSDKEYSLMRYFDIAWIPRKKTQGLSGYYLAVNQPGRDVYVPYDYLYHSNYVWRAIQQLIQTGYCILSLSEYDILDDYFELANVIVIAL